MKAYDITKVATMHGTEIRHNYLLIVFVGTATGSTHIR